jgi:hypothetical protein
MGVVSVCEVGYCLWTPSSFLLELSLYAIIHYGVEEEDHILTLSHHCSGGGFFPIWHIIQDTIDDRGYIDIPVALLGWLELYLQFLSNGLEFFPEWLLHVLPFLLGNGRCIDLVLLQLFLEIFQFP